MQRDLWQNQRAMEKSADFSPCRKYRYALWRTWGGITGRVTFIGLNPSTADETVDDPTIRRCIGYAKDWGYAGLCMVNLFAFRATNPADMVAVDDPVGPDNDDWLHDVIKTTSITIAAWGVNGSHLGRGATIRARFEGLHYLRLTKHGHPEHPLYLPKKLFPTPWADGSIQLAASSASDAPLSDVAA